ncbi:unnamed protein product [Closterium sp. NIES-54]
MSPPTSSAELLPSLLFSSPPDCFEIYALVPGLLREEVRVQCEPAGKLVIAGEPEQPDNPWGVTPFKKVILLPAAINANQTSAVVTLHGQLYVRAPLANPAPSALSPQLTPIPAPELPPPPLPPMGGGQGQGGQGQGGQGQGQGQGNQGNQGQMGQGQGGQVQGQGQQGVVAQGISHAHGHGYGHGHVKQQSFTQETNRQMIPKDESVETSPLLQQQQQQQQQQGGIEARAGPQQALAAGHAAGMQQQTNPNQLSRHQQHQQQQHQQQQPVQSQVEPAQQQMQPPRTGRSADVDMMGRDGGEGLREGGKDGNASVNKPNFTTESRNGMVQQLQQPQQGKQAEWETSNNEMKIGMAVTAAS